jgi:hypothetical protein
VTCCLTLLHVLPASAAHICCSHLLLAPLQLKQVQQAAAASCASAAAAAARPLDGASQLCISGSRTSAATGSTLEDLHSQVVRLKRHRDRLMRDQQELSRELADTRAELQGAQLKAAEAQVCLLLGQCVYVWGCMKL